MLDCKNNNNNNNRSKLAVSPFRPSINAATSKWSTSIRVYYSLSQRSHHYFVAVVSSIPQFLHSSVPPFLRSSVSCPCSFLFFIHFVYLTMMKDRRHRLNFDLFFSTCVANATATAGIICIALLLSSLPVQAWDVASARMCYILSSVDPQPVYGINPLDNNYLAPYAEPSGEETAPNSYARLPRSFADMAFDSSWGLTGGQTPSFCQDLRMDWQSQQLLSCDPCQANGYECRFNTNHDPVPQGIFPTNGQPWVYPFWTSPMNFPTTGYMFDTDAADSFYPSGWSNLAHPSVCQPIQAGNPIGVVRPMEQPMWQLAGGSCLPFQLDEPQRVHVGKSGGNDIYARMCVSRCQEHVPSSPPLSFDSALEPESLLYTWKVSTGGCPPNEICAADGGGTWACRSMCEEPCELYGEVCRPLLAAGLDNNGVWKEWQCSHDNPNDPEGQPCSAQSTDLAWNSDSSFSTVLGRLRRFPRIVGETADEVSNARHHQWFRCTPDTQPAGTACDVISQFPFFDSPNCNCGPGGTLTLSVIQNQQGWNHQDWGGNHPMYMTESGPSSSQIRGLAECSSCGTATYGLDNWSPLLKRHCLKDSCAQDKCNNNGVCTIQDRANIMNNFANGQSCECDEDTWEGVSAPLWQTPNDQTTLILNGDCDTENFVWTRCNQRGVWDESNNYCTCNADIVLPGEIECNNGLHGCCVGSPTDSARLYCMDAASTQKALDVNGPAGPADNGYWCGTSSRRDHCKALVSPASCTEQCPDTTAVANWQGNSGSPLVTRFGRFCTCPGSVDPLNTNAGIQMCGGHGQCNDMLLNDPQIIENELAALQPQSFPIAGLINVLHTRGCQCADGYRYDTADLTRLQQALITESISSTPHYTPYLAHVSCTIPPICATVDQSTDKSADLCGGHGHCSETTGVCQCDSMQYMGQRCESQCSDIWCHGQGVCDFADPQQPNTVDVTDFRHDPLAQHIPPPSWPDGKLPVCRCHLGFEGIDCSLQIPNDVDALACTRPAGPDTSALPSLSHFGSATPNTPLDAGWAMQLQVNY